MGRPTAPLPPHGTTRRYDSRDRCRCDECKRANRDKRRAWRARHQPAQNPRTGELPAHGTISRHQHRREPCRCDLCREAWNTYQANYQQRRRRQGRWPRATCRHCGLQIFLLEEGAPWRHFDQPVYGLYRCSLDLEWPVAEPA